MAEPVSLPANNQPAGESLAAAKHEYVGAGATATLVSGLTSYLGEAGVEDEDRLADAFAEIYRICDEALGADHPQTLEALGSVAMFDYKALRICRSVTRPPP